MGLLSILHVHPATVPVVLLAAILAVGACQPPNRAVTGVVLALQTEGTAVTGFTLRSDAGEVLQFRIGKLELTGGGFAASHLPEHAVTLEPVAVEYTLEGGERVAHRLVDAIGPSASP